MKKLLALVLSLFLPVASFAAVQIVVLSVADAGSNNIQYNYLCWLTTANPIAQPNLQSAWKASGASAGPTPAQVTALQNGTTIERQFSITLSSSTPVATVESNLVTRCNGEQSYLNGIPGPGTFYGETWNGTAWTLQ